MNRPVTAMSLEELRIEVEALREALAEHHKASKTRIDPMGEYCDVCKLNVRLSRS